MADALTSIFSLTKPEVNVSTTWPTSLNADLDSLDDLLARPKQTFNSPVVGATTTCDLSLARVFVFTVSQATTLAFTNVPSASFAVHVDLLITNGAAFVLTFPGSVNWPAGISPAFQTAGVERVRLMTRDGGTNWYAYHIGKSFKIKGDAYAFELQNSAGASIVISTATAGSRALQSRMGNAAAGNYLAVPVGIPTGGTTDVGTTNSPAGSPANLKSFASGLDTLNVTGQGFRIRAWGTSANNANAKTVRVAVGATQIISQTLQVSVVDTWHIDLLVFRTGATTADATAQGQTNGTSADSVAFVAVAGLGDWTAAGNTIQFSCTQTAAADVIQEGLLVEWLGA